MTRDLRSVRLSNGLRLPYVVQGDSSGVPVVLLHGPTDSWRSFELLLARLPASLRVFAVSQRGHGDADRPGKGYQPQDFADDVVTFMDAVGLKAAVLAGHSGAGFTVRRVAIDYPHRVLGLVLIAAPYTVRDKPGFADLLETVEALTDPVDSEFVREFVAGTVSAPLPPDFLETVIAECQKVPAPLWRATLSGLLEGDPRADSPRVPALLIWGDRDEICPRSEQEALTAAIPGAQLATYHGVGHSPHWENPAAAAADIATFAQRAHHARTS